MSHKVRCQWEMKLNKDQAGIQGRSSQKDADDQKGGLPAVEWRGRQPGSRELRAAAAEWTGKEMKAEQDKK